MPSVYQAKPEKPEITRIWKGLTKRERFLARKEYYNSLPKAVIRARYGRLNVKGNQQFETDASEYYYHKNKNINMGRL